MGAVDLQFADQYVNVVRPIKTKQEDLLSQDQLQEFYPSNQLVSSNIYPFSLDGLSAGTAFASTTNYLEPQHLRVSAVNTALNVYRYWPLSSVKDTILETDKDLVFGQDMYLRLMTNYISRLAYTGTSLANPVTGYAPFAGASATMYNPILYLAIEENLVIREEYLKHLASGELRIDIPYTYCYRFSASGTTANISLTLTKNYGRAVKRILVVPCNGQEFTNYAYDHSNLNGTKISTIQTTMDGKLPSGNLPLVTVM